LKPGKTEMIKFLCQNLIKNTCRKWLNQILVTFNRKAIQAEAH